MRQSLQDLDDQLQDHRVNRDVTLAMKADRAALIGDVQKLLDKANASLLMSNHNHRQSP